MIAIIDYGVGNLFSVCSSLKNIGIEPIVTKDKDVISAADKLILPGVGAFRDAANKLRSSGLDKVIIDEVNRGKEIMGICLGMQLLFEKGYEYGENEGLGLLKGNVIPLENYIPSELKVPHIGWNKLKIERDNHLFRHIKEGDFVYFVHSYHVIGCEDSLIATAEYGSNLTAAVKLNNVMGCQFHPEKSGEVGLSILRAFCEGEEI